MSPRRGCIRWATSPCRPRAGACLVWFPGPLTAQGFQGVHVAARLLARLRRRDASGSPRVRRPRDLRVVPHGLMVGGARPHARRPALVIQVPHRVGQRSMPRRFRLPPCPVGRHCCIAGWSIPPLGFPAGGGVSVRCGGPPISSVGFTVGFSRCGWAGGAGSVAASLIGRAASRAWPSDTGGGPGRLPGPADRRATAGTVVRAGSGLGSGFEAGRRGDDGSVGRTAGPAGGAQCRLDAGSARSGAWRWSPWAGVLGVTGAWRLGLSVSL